MKTKNIIEEGEYWNSFYSSSIYNDCGSVKFDMPSQFCSLFVSETDSAIPVVELGCGNGRDSLFMGRHGYKVDAMDLSASAVAACQEKAIPLEFVDFHEGDVSNENDIDGVLEGAKLKSASSCIAIYSRFFLHSIDSEQESILLEYLSNKLDVGDIVYLEFRSAQDANITKIFSNHYRRYIDTEMLCKAMEILGFQITYSITGQGMAKYKSEDPFVSRIIAKKV